MINAHTLAQTLLTMIDESKGKKEREQVIEQFVSFARRRGLTFQLPNVIRELQRMNQRADRNNSVRLETATEMDDKTLAAIIKSIGATEASMEHTVNPELMGGFRVRWQDYEYDASVERDVNRLEHSLSSR